VTGGLGVLTTGRQDWGILRSTCSALRDSSTIDLRLLVGGMHCADRFGRTMRHVEEDGFVPAEVLPWVGDGDMAVEDQAAEALRQVSGALGRQRVEALLLVGDRFETAAAALAATLGRVPLVHVHGGEETEGALDNACRHAITKMAHLHLVSHAQHAARVVALGEDAATVHVVGAPGLDNLRREDLPGREDLGAFLGLELTPPVVLVTLHPATLAGDPEEEARALAEALDAVAATYVITLPNTDPGHQAVRAVLASAARRPGRMAREALGEKRYWGLLKVADALVGNSSSGLIEAPSVGLPAVNVGDRQKGRLRGANVIDVPATAEAIATGLRRALDPAFRRSVASVASPFGDGRSGPRILDILSRWQPPRPPVKRAVPVPR
jgi:UDP-hydrolysing UDP-N-acetyl-D-glucosamine 2-epimerase